MKVNEIHCGDCLELMKEIDSKSVNMILCDLPYGTTSCSWDSIIPLEKLWIEYKRIIKDNGCILLFGSQPFTSMLIMSNLNWFKYCWVWNKKKAGNIFVGKYQPLKIHEDIVVFSKGTHKYYPQKEKRKEVKRSKNYGIGEIFGGNGQIQDKVYEYTDKFPVSIIDFSNAYQGNKIHPTEKPVELLRYLIKSYTDEGDLILDNSSGSGSLAVASKQTNRNFICIEINPEFVEQSNKRLEQQTLT